MIEMFLGMGWWLMACGNQLTPEISHVFQETHGYFFKQQKKDKKPPKESSKMPAGEEEALRSFLKGIPKGRGYVGCRIGNEKFDDQELSEVTNLSLLDVHPPKDLVRLAELKNLKYLSLTCVTWDESLVQALASLKSLKALELSVDGISDDMLGKIVQDLGELAEFSLRPYNRIKAESRGGIKGTFLTQLSQSCPKLTTLNVSWFSFDVEAWKTIKSLGAMTALVIDNMELDQAFIDAIAQCQALERLKFLFMNLHRVQLGVLKAPPKFKGLEFEGCTVHPECLKTIADIPQLQSLEVMKGRNPREVLRLTPKLQNLESLFLWEQTDNIAPADLELLKLCKKLKKLQLKLGMTLRDELVKVLCTMDTLQSLSFSSMKVSDLQMAELKKSLMNCKFND